MRLKNYITVFGLGLLSLAFSGCNDFLSTLPDNRMEIESDESIKKILVSAYPTNAYVFLAEMSSDNVVENADATSFTTRFQQQLYNWDDVTETDNESPASLWQAAYSAIQSANLALQAIEKQGNPESLKKLRAEALMSRAYNHFIVTQIFAEAYDPKTAEQKLGVPYMRAAETTLNPKYERESLASNMASIEKDIAEALPSIDDIYGTTIKFHFNKKAAYAFAARFYLFYQKWDKALECANVVLGTNPDQVLLRNYAEIAQLPSGAAGFNNRALKWIDANSKNNLLMHTAYSRLSYYYGFNTTGARYSHISSLANTETTDVPGAWGSTSYKLETVEVASPYFKVLLPSLPYQFEYTNRQLGVGYVRTTYVALSTDETLLVRAEAKVMLGDFEGAIEDMNIYLANLTTNAPKLSDQKINDWNSSVAYHTPTVPTPRKKLNPSWTISEKQEQYLQVLLHLRRIETLQLGLRWFDVKRYGIEITRVRVVGNNTPVATANVLTKDDPRRALQLPEEVVSAGLTPNRK